MNGSKLDEILTRRRNFRNRLLRIHGVGLVYPMVHMALLAIQITIVVFDLLPKWTIGILPMAIIIWGVFVTVLFEMHSRRSQKEIDDYFDKPYSKTRVKNEKHIRSSLEE